MIPVMDSFNYGYGSTTGSTTGNDDIECGVSPEPDASGAFYHRCGANVPIPKGTPLTFQYSAAICRLDAIRTWGFYHVIMPACDSEDPDYLPEIFTDEEEEGDDEQ